MLIRFIVNNLYSFGEEREFNMLPQPRLGTLKHHKYKLAGLDVLKMAAIYGPNGAGKSNLVKALALLQEMVVGKKIPHQLGASKFKFRKPETIPNQLFVIEFVQSGIPFYYSLEIADQVVISEELHISGLGEKDDQLIFERKIDEAGELQLSFKPSFEADEESKVYKNVLIKSFIKPGETMLLVLHQLGISLLKEVGIAFEWFKSSLSIITPEHGAPRLPYLLDQDPQFKSFADQLVQSFDLGILGTSVESWEVEKDRSKAGNFEQTIEEIEQSPNEIVSRYTSDNGWIVLKKQDDKIIAQRILLRHQPLGSDLQLFELGEESDGTNRLLDFLPLLYSLAMNPKVYVVDEIERSLHPMMIKEIISKFSSNEGSKGQLIFTTHESILLDQEILRKDEIWFAEKDWAGGTDLYSLSDYKPHNTIDIRKGYLEGRYGAIPFLGNFHNFRWPQHAPQA